MTDDGYFGEDVAKKYDDSYGEEFVPQARIGLGEAGKLATR